MDKRNRALILTAATALLVSAAAGIPFIDDSEPTPLNQSVAEKLEFEASNSEIANAGQSLIDRFRGLFSVVDRYGYSRSGYSPGQYVKYEVDLDIDNFDTSCDSLYSTKEEITFDMWLEGQNTGKSETVRSVTVSCSGDGEVQEEIEFRTPGEEGSHTYEVKIGSETALQSWGMTVDSDTIEVNIPDLNADLAGPETVLEGETGSFQYTGTDGYNAISWYKWSVDGELLDGDELRGGESKFDHRFDEPGLREVKVEASDNLYRVGDRRWDSASITVNVKPDSDDDGTPDGQDNCPNTSGSEATNGCPDSDGDGIIDRNDDCEETAGIEQFNGCPDSDGDGVPDDIDECPDTPGTQELNGCKDSDGDGIIDSNDQCPTEEGVARLDGCPDRPPEQLQISAPAEAEVGETFTAETTAVDPESSELEFTWSNGVKGSTSAFTFNSAGIKTVSVEVSDGPNTVDQNTAVEVVQKTSEPGETTQPEQPDDNQDDSTETTVNPVEAAFFGFIDVIGGLF